MKEVIGIKGGSLILTWIIQNLHHHDSLLATVLSVNDGRNSKTKLFEGVTSPHPTEAARNLYGSRMSVKFLKRAYQVIINNWQCSDTMPLLLTVVVQGDEVFATSSVIQITPVKGRFMLP